jgi:TIR domain
MSALDPIIIDDLICLLSERPGVNTRKTREDSWMTAPEIAVWIKTTRGIDIDPNDIDQALLTWWRAAPASQLIRPAKYPAVNTLLRLWGHVDRVGRLSETELQSLRNDQPVELETFQHKPGARVCFLSYAAPDLHFAARMRLFLAGLGIEAWMYSREIEEQELVFEGVRAAIQRADFLLALITPQSIASAWVWTEVNFADAIERPVVHVFDGSDRKLVALLKTWEPPTSHGTRHFDETALAAVKQEYARYNAGERLAKFETSATSFLFSMSSFTKCIYPRRPASTAIHESIKDFQPTLRDIIETLTE